MKYGRITNIRHPVYSLLPLRKTLFQMPQVKQTTIPVADDNFAGINIPQSFRKLTT
jgi:hypothetical protein